VSGDVVVGRSRDPNASVSAARGPAPATAKSGKQH
jgi:hypothetical protein